MTATGSGRRAVRTRPARSALTIISAVTGAAFLLPIVWLVAGALRPASETFQYLSPLSFHALVPARWTTTNLSHVLTGPFLHAMVNSLAVAVATTLIGLIVTVLAAFGLTAVGSPHRDKLFVVVVISFMLPFESLSVQLADLFRGWHLDNTYLGLVAPGVANGLAIFLVRQFFMNIPRELTEAARVDGAGWLYIAGRIFVPLSKAPLVGAGVILFNTAWQGFIWPLLIAPDPQYEVAPIALANFQGAFTTDFGAIFAGAVLVLIVPAAVLLSLQSQFTQSVVAAGVKG